MSNVNINKIEKELEIYLKNINNDYEKLEYILQNTLLLQDNYYINYKTKIFQNIFKSLDKNKENLFNIINNKNKYNSKINIKDKNITNINYNSSLQWLKLFSKYPNIIDPKFNTKLSKTDLLKQYIGVNNFKDLANKLYSTYRLNYSTLNNDLKFGENKYNIWRLSAMQKVLRNLISPNTPYNGILIIHGTGVGKTCTAITIAENFKDYVIENNTKIQVIRPDEFKRQIFEINKLKQGEPDIQCTGTTYIDEINNQSLFIENVKNCQKNKNKLEQDKACKNVEKIINKKINEYYDFKSRAIWIKTIIKTLNLKTKGLSGLKKQRKLIEIIRLEFNNSIIIIDEVHNLRNLDVDNNLKSNDNNLKSNDNDNDKLTNKLKNINIIQLLELILLIAQNVRIIMLSATPMYDRASDIIPLLNLLLLNDYRPRITEKDLFTDEYGSIIPDKGPKLINNVSRGYISYVRGNDPENFPLRLNANIGLDKSELFDINKYPKYDISGTKNITIKERIKYLTLVNCQLTNQHSNAIINKNKYISNNNKNKKLSKNTNSNLIIEQATQLNSNESTDEDYRYSVAYSTELQLGNFMYKTPNETMGNFQESYGLSGFNSSFIKDKSGSFVCKDKEILNRFKMPELSKYGPKISKILSLLEKATGPIAIYSNYIYGGLIPMVIALELVGYTRYDGVKEFIKSNDKPKNSKGQYVLFTGDKQMSKGGEKYVNLRNSMINEKEVKVFLFSNAGSEGISLFGYREMHIMEPWHNINLIEQSIGRIIRNKSHHHLEPRYRNATIYMYASTFSKEFEDRESIDLRIYSICEQKAIAIGFIETLLKSNAFDCIITRELNIRDEKYFGKKIEIENSQGEKRMISLQDIEYSRDTSYQKTGYYTCNIQSVSANKLSSSKSESKTKLELKSVLELELSSKTKIISSMDTLSKIRSVYYIELREMRQLIIKILQHQGTLSYNDIKYIVINNLELDKNIKRNIILKFLEILLEDLIIFNRNNIYINSKGEICKLFLMNSVNIKSLKGIVNKKILRLLPINKYDPNLDLLHQFPSLKKSEIIKYKNIKNIDYKRLNLDKDSKYDKVLGVDLTELIELKQKTMLDLQKKEELSLEYLILQINEKMEYILGLEEEDKQYNKFNYNTNFNINNKSQIGKLEILASIFERLLINEKIFLLMYLVTKLVILGYDNCSILEKDLLIINYFNIVLEDELNFLKKLGNITSTSPTTSSKKYSNLSDFRLDKNELINKLRILSNNTSNNKSISNNNNNVKGFIIANDKGLKYYELLDMKIIEGKIISYNYLKSIYKDNKINLDKIMKSKYNKMKNSTISRLYGYLIYEKKLQQPKFKITDYISRGYKKSVKGIFCANKHIGEIEKLINMLIPKNKIKELEFIIDEKKNKKLFCGDLEIFFRIRNNNYNNSFDSHLDSGIIYYLTPEQYFIWNKYNKDFE